jgi:hypothetical protein
MNSWQVFNTQSTYLRLLKYIEEQQQRTKVMADIESYIRSNISEPSDFYEEELFKPLLRHG